MAVFPIRNEPGQEKLAEEYWWKIRSLFAENKRFLLANTSYMQQKDVFQARAELTPSDAIILGEILDAHLLVTTVIENKKLSMFIYESLFGRLVWKAERTMPASIPTSEQLPDLTNKLVKDFMASIPFQGFVFVDPLIGKVVYAKEKDSFLQVEVGEDVLVEAGDDVQLLKLNYNYGSPLFMGGATVEVFAEGKVSLVNHNIITVQLLRATDLQQIKEESLVRFPKEVKRMKELFRLSENLKSRVDPESFAPGMKALTREQTENKALITSVAFLLNIIGVLLVAF